MRIGDWSSDVCSSDLSVISNNIANAGSIGFKRSSAQFGDIFASSPNQSTRMIAGQGTRLNGITQEFTQGSYETSEKTLDMAIVGEGLFVVKGAPPPNAVTYSRNGAFNPPEDAIGRASVRERGCQYG